MKTLEFEARKLKLKFDDIEIFIEYPKLKNIKKYQEDLDKSESYSLKIDKMVDFLHNLGVPVEKCWQLENYQLEEILEELTSGKKK